MIKISIFNKIMFLLTGHLAGYKVVSGMQPYSDLTTFYYTISFGMLVLACLLLMLLGFDILKNKSALILAMLIPVGLSLGIINQYLPQVHYMYLIVSIIGMTMLIFFRLYSAEKISGIILSLVHGISGIIIVWMPLVLFLNGKHDGFMLLVSLGGIIIGLKGILLASLKMGKPIIQAEKLYSYFPAVLFLASASFVVGMQN